MRSSVSSALIPTFMVGSLLSTVSHRKPGPAAITLLHHLRSLPLNPAAIAADPDALDWASNDYGGLVRAAPAAVFRPASVRDVAELVALAHSLPRPFAVAARGCGHSVRGQALARDGVVVEMAALRRGRCRIRVWAGEDGRPAYVDAGGEQMWIDVLRETLKHGLAPRSWTDYLHLTVGGTLSNAGVGGTLSNAGVGGHSFLYGPQISNVYELDAITGKGGMVTCSEQHEADLFFAVLGGLGQFGIITRARIAIEPAPLKVRWVRLIYTDFAAFTRDQEKLKSLDQKRKGLNYIEGSVIMADSLTNNWRSSFYLEEDIRRITRLAARHGAIYCLEGAKNYDHATAASIDQELEMLLQDLSFVPGFQFRNDVTFVHFLDRVYEGEQKLRAKGLWSVPHPWRNVLVPASRILDFDRGVFRSILRQNDTVGPILIYATNWRKWDPRMSAVTPQDEEIFYSVGLLRPGVGDRWKFLEEQNEEILRFCDAAGIRYKQYLPHYVTPAESEKHFGAKWKLFVERKTRYDPKALLAPGQRIFSPSIDQQ